jgi:hypothetical protein
MTSQDETTSAIPLPPAPYVGMRAFEATERSIFFGRNQDATLLRDKVFSARLTVFYGPSGIGKSSILRALLVPDLEKEEARAIYFDDWRADDPLATLKSMLLEEAHKLNIPDFGAGPPGLVDFFRLLLSADNRTVVLVLDQFEEFFTHGHCPDPFRKELGALVRTHDLDVRILLSLREEHLASLGAFLSEIMDLFHSTSRLEPLKDDAIREAIENPASLFEAHYEPEFVKKLIDDLRQEQPKTEIGTRSQEDAPVDLPMLQLLCEELWKKGDKKTISLDLYRRLGGQKGILEAYLKDVMPNRWKQKELTARLMEYLAPSDGHKMSFSAGFLANRTELPVERVQAELDRLSDPEVQVLRSSSEGEGNVRYELRHDSFIRIIAPWRDGVLSQHRFWRWTLGSVAGLIVLAVAALSVDLLMLRANTAKILAHKKLSAEVKFDHVAKYLLWTRNDYYPASLLKNRLDLLREILQEHESDIPRWFGIEHSGLEFVTLPPATDDMPLTVHYSSARKLNQYVFTQTWQKAAKYLNDVVGIPAPLKLKLVKEDTFLKEQVRLTGQNIEDLDLRIPAPEKDAFLSSSKLSESGKEFLSRFKPAWTQDTRLKYGGPWWIVPRWSLPAWKASGVMAIDISGLPAFHLTALLLNEYPDRLLNPVAMEILLNRVAESYPLTEAEARAVRGKRLPQDFQEFLKSGRNLTGLPVLLDTLANYPEGSSVDIIPKVIDDLNMAQTSFLGAQLRGPHPADKCCPKDEAQIQAALKNLHWSYRTTATWLPEVEPQIRIFLGKHLNAALTTEHSLRPELDERLGTVQDSLMRRYGISLPGARIWPDLEIPPNAFRIELLNQDAQNSLTKPVIVSKNDDALNRLSAAMIFRTELYRTSFLDAELVQIELKYHMNPALRAWLQARYSLTDLKLLLRSLVNPSKEELEARRHTVEARTLDQPLMVPAEDSIRQPAWLLASLIFWSKVHASQGDYLRSLPAVAGDLRQTQRARIAPKPVNLQNPEVARLIATGVDSLGQGRIGEAETAFTSALKSDKDAAISSFLILYPQELRQSLIRKLTDSRIPLQSLSVSVTPAERIDLEDLLAEKDFDQNTGVQTACRLRLCLLAVYPDNYQHAKRDLVNKIVKQHGKPEEWPAVEAAWFGTRLLTSFDPLTDERSIPQTGLAFLQKALPQLNPDQAMKVSREVIGICLQPGPNQWCWDLLPDLAGVRDEPEIKLQFTVALAGRSRQADLERALTLANQAKQALPDPALSQEEQERLSDWLDYMRATTLLRLEKLGAAAGGSGEAESILLRIAGSQALGGLPFKDLALLMWNQNRHAEATSTLDWGMQKFPDVEELYGSKLYLRLATGDAQGVARLALESLGKVKKDRDGKITQETQGLAFVAALGLLVTKSGAWESVACDFLQTDHQYVPYVAMILASHLTAKKDKAGAQEVIDRRWARVKPDTWSVRLRQGDETVWREMLIGYYLGKVKPGKIFAELEDESQFAKSDLRHVPLSRRGMLCEAYFYDALLAEANGNEAWMRTSLEKTLGTDSRDDFEYTMAQFLLSKTKKP